MLLYVHVIVPGLFVYWTIVYAQEEPQTDMALALADLHEITKNNKKALEQVQVYA